MSALVDVSRALKRLTVALSVSRAAEGWYTNGRWNEGSASTVPITGSVQQLTPAEMKRLPEGQRAEATRKLYTTTLLKTADVSTGTRADRFTYLGDTWEVFSVGDWDDLGGYYKAIVTRDGQ